MALKLREILLFGFFTDNMRKHSRGKRWRIFLCITLLLTRISNVTQTFKSEYDLGELQRGRVTMKRQFVLTCESYNYRTVCLDINIDCINYSIIEFINILGNHKKKCLIQKVMLEKTMDYKRNYCIY